MGLARAPGRRVRACVVPQFDDQELLSFDCGRTRWRALAEFADDLFDNRALISPTDRAGFGGEIVKSGPHRTVTRLRLTNGTIYLKHNKTRDWMRLLQSLFRPSKAVREWNAARRVAARGVATIETVAVGRTTSGAFVTDDYLVTREIEHTQSVVEYLTFEAPCLSPRLQAVFRRQLATQLGVLAARLHGGGLVHGDFHADNILIRAESGGSLRVWLVDLQEVHEQHSLGIRQIERNLSLLYNSLNLHATAADRLRFFRSYWQTLRKAAPTQVSLPRGLADTPFPQIVRRIETHCRVALRRANRKADAKWERGNRRLIIADTGKRSCRGLASIGRQLLQSIRDDPEQLFNSALAKPTEMATAELLIGGQIMQCVVAASPRSNGRRLLKHSGSAARRAWETGHQLLRRGIGTPRPLLFVATPEREYLVTERVPGAVRLSKYLGELATLEPDFVERSIAVCADRLADQLRTMREQGFEHRQLSLETILVIPTLQSCEVSFLSVQNVRRRRRLSCSRTAKQLAELFASVHAAHPLRRSQCLRFLRRYLKCRYSLEWKPLWRSVAGRILRRNISSAALWHAAAAAVLWTAVAAGCRTVDKVADKPVSLPSRHSVRSEQLLVLSDFKLPKDHPLLADLNRLRYDVARGLDLPPVGTEVVVYLFSTELEFKQYLTAAYPGLPHRRAYFVGTPRELAVYTFWGDRIQEDLRHEYTHGLLHASLKDVPLWLDEGLAEYFEVSGIEPGGANPECLERLARSLSAGWRPDLKRLEGIQDFSQMKRGDYEESWAWVHFLLHSSPETRQLLQKQVAELREHGQSLPLSAQLSQLIPNYEPRFVDYVQTLSQSAVASANP
jgi:hypothetical protein